MNILRSIVTRFKLAQGAQVPPAQVTKVPTVQGLQATPAQGAQLTPAQGTQVPDVQHIEQEILKKKKTHTREK